MSKIESLEREIERLSPEDLAEFRRWFTSFDAAMWDQQIESDVRDGKLDALAEKALRDHAASGIKSVV